MKSQAAGIADSMVLQYFLTSGVLMRVLISLVRVMYVSAELNPELTRFDL